MNRELTIFTIGGTIDKIYFDDLSDYQVGHPFIEQILDKYKAYFTWQLKPLFKKDSLDLTDEAGAVIRHVWTGSPGEVYGSPYEGWWFTKVRGLYRENQPFHETALEAMEAADRAGGSDV